ncbi:MAG TPA: hypothetical protein VJ732_01705 [Bryobacteraceae bacterium]|nr:hypothetical protein [Bryobacteraceae bacterium]
MGNMEAMWSNPSPVFEVWFILFACAFCAHPLHGESVVGVVYSNTVGNGVHAAGRVELGIGPNVLKLDYAEPLDQHFSSAVCKDLGAIWTVEVQRLDNSLYIRNVTCTGQIDKAVHESWAVVRDYLNSLPASVLSSVALSPHYLSSREFEQFRKQVNSHDLNSYYDNHAVSQCLRIIGVDRSQAVTIAANCPIELKGRVVGLIFRVVGERTKGTWEIDGITVN